MVWLNDQLKSEMKKGYSSHKCRSAHLIAEPVKSKKVVEEYKMICDWLANWKCLFPRESSIKVNVFRVGWEKISDDHTEDRWIRKEISPRTKASLAKASLSK